MSIKLEIDWPRVCFEEGGMLFEAIGNSALFRMWKKILYFVVFILLIKVKVTRLRAFDCVKDRS